MDPLGRNQPPPISSNHLISSKSNGFNTIESHNNNTNTNTNTPLSKSLAITPTLSTQFNKEDCINYDDDDDGLVNGSHTDLVVSGRTPMFCGMRSGRVRRRRKLLVLDLNGVLVDIVCNVPPGYRPDKRIRRKAVFKRPSCDDFLKFCFEKFDVGVWSSKLKKNVDDLVDFLMGEMKHHLLFCWDRSHCTETGFQTIENRHKPLVFKDLKKLWYKQEPNLPWENGDYDLSNTLLLDDSPYKALRNPPHTAVFPHSYTFKDTDDKSLGPGGDIRVYLEGLHMAEDVQKYVEQHPFGQHFITNMSPSWAFYNNIVSIQNSKDLQQTSNDWFKKRSVGSGSPFESDFISNLA